MKKILAFSIVISILVSMIAGITVGYSAGTNTQSKPFLHPGILHTQADFDRITKMVQAEEKPYIDGWNVLVNSKYSQAGWKSRAVAQVNRGGNGDNVALLYNDIAYAYQNALRWKISGDTDNGDTARDILNSWSSTMKSLGGNADRYLASGIFGYQMANAAEIMRGYPGFNVKQMQDMLLNVFYKPLNERFLYGDENGKGDHNDAYIQNYWANWDLCNMAATVAIGIFCDRRDIYNRGVEYFKYGAGNGSIYNSIPFLHPDGLAQWQESGRDQGHVNLGVGLMASTCEMAWNQSDDLYGWANNRFMRAAEYVAKYNNGEDVPFSTYEWGTGQKGNVQQQKGISGGGRGEMRPIWEMIYNHYAKRKGLSVPNIAARAEKMRPEGGPGGHPTTFDQPGFGTLLYTRPAGGGDSATLPSGNVKDGIYRFVVRHTGKALYTDGTSVQQMTVDENGGQQWYVQHLGGGEYRILNAQSGLSLEVTDGSHDHGAALQLGEFKNLDYQRFAFIPVGGEYYRITPVNSNKPLDVAGVSKEDGAKIQQWRYLGGANQQWRLEFIKDDDKKFALDLDLTTYTSNKPNDADITENTETQAIQVKINNQLLQTEVSPIMLNDRVMVPLRVIFEKLGGELEWIDSTQTIKGKKGDRQIELQIDDITAKINGEDLELDVPAKIINDRTFVPLRFISESLGAEVKWDDKNNTAEITIK